MTNDSRTGAFWDRHNERMQDPEHAARFNTEIARIRAVDARVNANDDLRTALAELADDWTGTGSGTADVISRELRRLLAAHPARPTLAHAYLNPINGEGSEAGCALWLPDGGVCGQARSAHPAPVSDTRREDVARALGRHRTWGGHTLTCQCGADLSDGPTDRVDDNWRHHLADVALAAHEAEVREHIAQDIEAAARANLALGLYEAVDIVRGATR